MFNGPYMSNNPKHQEGMMQGGPIQGGPPQRVPGPRLPGAPVPPPRPDGPPQGPAGMQHQWGSGQGMGQFQPMQMFQNLQQAFGPNSQFGQGMSHFGQVLGNSAAGPYLNQIPNIPFLGSLFGRPQPQTQTPLPPVGINQG